ncbi:MAG: sensor histidine kinase, partial [Geodermatophilaceae bacterium]
AKTRMLDTLQALRALADGDVAAAGSAAYAIAVDLGDLARRAVESARSRAGDVTLTLQLPHDDALVQGSPAGLRLAIGNLVANALRHAHAQRIEVGVQRRDGAIVVWVDDDGVGLPAAERELVFARFTRGSQATGSGSGLGLALAAQQAELHGGRVGLTESPWGGLRAEFEIPAVQPGSS